MHVIDVIPFSASAPAGTLSYRSKEALAPGTLVSVPLRGKRVRGVVTGSVPVADAKGALKKAPFQLRAGTLSSEGALPKTLMEAAARSAAYHAAPLGSVLSALYAETLPAALPESFAPGGGFARETVELPYAARRARYEAIIEEEAAAGRASVLVLPTLAELGRAASELACRAPILVSGNLAAGKRAAALSAAAESRGLVLATPAFLGVPVAHLGALMVERASAGGYRGQKRPYLDLVRAAEEIARAREARFVLGDYPLPLELRDDAGGLSQTALLAPAALLDTSGERPAGESFRAVPEEVLRALARVFAEGGRSAVLAVRRGYAPAVVCRDCGASVRGPDGRALSFFARGARVLRSADGTVRKSADTVCDVCGSWNLLPLGIGVERVAEEIHAALPDATIVPLDADALKTPAAARKAAAVLAQPGAIGVGTESMLPLLDPAAPLDYAAVASADSLLALPFWRARERFVRAAATLRDRAKEVAIASRRGEDAALAAALDPASAAFWEEESSLRTALSYPPAGHLFAFHAEGSRARVEEAAAAIQAACGGLRLMRLPDRAQGTRLRLSMVAKTGAAWPDPAVSARIAALPPWIERSIDTESLW